MRGFRRPPGAAAAVAGGTLVLVLLVVDLAVGTGSAALIPVLLAGPALAAVTSPPRLTLWVALLAIACGLGITAGEGFDGDHLIALAALVIGCAFAVLASLGRRRFEEALRAERAGRVRSEFAARTGRLLEAPPDPDAMLAQVVRLAVPDMADLCVVDLHEDGALTGSVVHGTDPDRVAAVRLQRERFAPAPDSEHPAPTAIRTGAPALVAELPPERLREYAQSDEHYELMLRMRHKSAMFVPLIARGRTLGVMTLSRAAGGRRYSEDDLELAVEVARRAALALDNARLFGELQRAEAQLDAVLANLAEAVTVQRPDGELVYLNAAAARTLSLDDVQAGLSIPIDELRGGFLPLDEYGQPVAVEQMPGRRALAGEDPEPMLMRAVRRDTGCQRWMLVKATAIRGERGEPVLAVNVIEDVTEQRLAERQQRFLAEASKLLSASLDLEVTYERIASAAVPELADWCCVDVPDERGGLRRAAIVGAEDEQAALDRLRAALYLDPDDPASVAHMIRTGHPVLSSELDDEALEAWTGGDPAVRAAVRATGTGSALAVPMTAGDRIVGMITLGTTHSERRLEGAELALALELGARAGIAVENARVHAARSHIATTLQRSLLPPRLPVIPGLTIAARFRAAGDTTEVGGDFYDLFSADGWMVVIGDVTGKGPEAAATTSLARFTMRTAAMYERSPAAVLARLNATLAVDPDRRQICTAVCARIEPGADGVMRVEVACGGHPPPLLVGEDVREAGRPGSLLGAFETGTWTEDVVELDEGQSLVLFTDGVTDARGAGGARFGGARLRATLQAASGRAADDI
ncbi:MAG: SpoIIE family protein phosphatase, partial [Solirubrobacteraceae bacterium]